MVTIRPEIATDIPAREALLTRAFGPKRFRKTSEKLRHHRLPAEGLAFSALDDEGHVIGTIRLWNIIAGSAGEALLLGPLAVDAQCQNHGLGAKLMATAINAAIAAGHKAILLVGDQAYYTRFGFDPALTANLSMPGPVERHRFLGLELVRGALTGAEGMVLASGRMVERDRRVA